MNKTIQKHGTADQSEIDYDLRPATANDFDFTHGMYIRSMEPLLSALNAWDLEKSSAAFRSYFVPEEIEIVTVNGSDVGWFQTTKSDTDVFLDQLHLVEEVRRKGIGTKLIEMVIDRARRENRSVSLSFIKGNPALKLYEKCGFRLVAEDETKFHMRLRAD